MSIGRRAALRREPEAKATTDACKFTVEPLDTAFNINDVGMAPASPLQQIKSLNGSTAKPPAKKVPQLNVVDVILGEIWMKPWYPSFYPEELVGKRTEKLFVCQWCFKYSKDLIPYIGHTAVCPLRTSGPPGVSIYSQSSFSIHEIDGEEHKLFTQNLSLFAKLFLETKSVFFDVTSFLYYLLIYNDPSPQSSAKYTGPQVVGFFSKEKLSWDNNNLACILVFPPWQKKGFGQVLMGVSYVLSKRERRLGGPEKPVSELGRRSYERFWAGVIARAILGMASKKVVTVEDLVQETYINHEDMIPTLKGMGVLEMKKKGAATAVINKARVKMWMESNKVALDSPVDLEAFTMESVDGSDSSDGSDGEMVE